MVLLSPLPHHSDACRCPTGTAGHGALRRSGDVHNSLRLSLSVSFSLILGVSAGLIGPAYVYAQPTENQNGIGQVYAIAGGRLSDVLAEFAAMSQVQLVFDPQDFNGLHSSGLRGRYRVQDGFARILQGTGWTTFRKTDGSFGIRLERQDIQFAQGVPMLAAVSATDSEINATTEGTKSFAARAVSMNKGEQALRDIPQSISVMTRKQLDEQGITDLRVAANNITGLVGAKGVGQGMVLSARGFQIDAWQYDGVPVPRNMYALGNWGTEGMVFYDRLEVLRGASGLLQGTGSPGGAVNLVRKRGQTEKTLTLTARAGSWDRYGLQLDAGGPLNDEGSLRGRMVVDEARSHSFVDYVKDRTRSLYLALDLDVGANTTLGVGVSNMLSKSRPMVRGLPRYPDGSDLGLDRSTFVGAWWNRARIDQTTVYADLEHRFNPEWKLKVSALHMDEKNTSVHQRMHGNVAADGSGLTFANWATDFDSKKDGLDAFVNGRFDLLGMRNEVTVGANYSKYTSRDMWARTFTPGGNIFDIDHNRPWQDLDTIMAAGGVKALPEYDVRQKGIYASMRTRVAQPLTLILGARASWYNYLYREPLAATQSRNTASGEITPYAGVVFELNPEWSAYASYTSVFEPQSERTVAGDVVDPIIGTNYELGIKGELLDSRVNTSLALFRYDHKNRAVSDTASGFACDGYYCSVASGKVRSQGIEAEISGEVAPNLQLVAGYTYNSTKFRSDPTNKGKVFSTWTPRHMLRTWASYQFSGELNKLTVGGGFVTQSHTLGYDRSFKVPGFTVWNMRAAYQVSPQMSVALNLNNVFNKRYWIPGFAQQDGNNDYGDPRNVMLTVTYAPKF